MAENHENVIEWLSGQNQCTATLSQKKYVNKIKKIIDNGNKDVDIVAENQDGSICVHVPVSWIKISPPRQVSDEQREAAAERLRLAREVKNGDK